MRFKNTINTLYSQLDYQSITNIGAINIFPSCTFEQPGFVVKEGLNNFIYKISKGLIVVKSNYKS